MLWTGKAQEYCLSISLLLRCAIGKADKDMEMRNNEAAVRTVCVIYTGGTIGMLLGEHGQLYFPSANRMLMLALGFQPEPFYLTSALLNETRFHDHAGDSLLSNSANIHDWRNHRSSNGHLDPHRALDSAKVPSEYTLPVRSTRPIVHSDGTSSRKISESCYETSLPSLITPASSTDTKVRYVILEVLSILWLYGIRNMTNTSVATDSRQQVLHALL